MFGCFDKNEKFMRLCDYFFRKKRHALCVAEVGRNHHRLKADELDSEKKLEKEFVRYSRKRVRELKSSFAQIIEKSDSGAVHDFRKATRHLQTIVAAIWIRPPLRKGDKLRGPLPEFRPGRRAWR